MIDFYIKNFKLFYWMQNAKSKSSFFLNVLKLRLKYIENINSIQS